LFHVSFAGLGLVTAGLDYNTGYPRPVTKHTPHLHRLCVAVVRKHDVTAKPEVHNVWHCRERSEETQLEPVSLALSLLSRRPPTHNSIARRPETSSIAHKRSRDCKRVGIRVSFQQRRLAKAAPRIPTSFLFFFVLLLGITATRLFHASGACLMHMHVSFDNEIYSEDKTLSRPIVPRHI